jgi:ABC-type multidrug transport system fused ATPase/permease subunit
MFVSGARRRLLEGTGQRFVFDLRQMLVGKLARLPLAFYNEAQTGDLLSRVSADVDAVQEVVVNGSDTLVASLLRILGVATIFCALNLKLGLATLAPIFLVGVLLRAFNKQVKPIYARSRRQLGSLTARLSESLTGIRVVKGFARELEENSAFRRFNEAFLGTNLEAIRKRSFLFPFVTFVLSFTNTILLAFGGWLILHGEFTIGGLVAYRTYGRYFYGPMDNLTQINDMVQRAIAAGNRIFEVVDAPETVVDLPGATALRHVEGHIEFRNVSFDYGVEASPHAALSDVSFTVEPGQRIAIVGESGAGKSTVFALLARLWDPSTGAVLLDGKDLRSYEVQSVRRQVVTVPQDTFLFAAGVGENIRFGRPEATDTEVEAAARAANAHEFIERLPADYGTLVGERGIKLSGGQRQRISVARAFLANGSVLILDEATSAVEPESERLIYESLNRLLEGRTALIATHRLSTIRRADRIIVMSRGRIVESGTHHELVRRGGVYASMVSEQDEGQFLIA